MYASGFLQTAILLNLNPKSENSPRKNSDTTPTPIPAAIIPVKNLQAPATISITAPIPKTIIAELRLDVTINNTAAPRILML